MVDKTETEDASGYLPLEYPVFRVPWTGRPSGRRDNICLVSSAARTHLCLGHAGQCSIFRIFLHHPPAGDNKGKQQNYDLNMTKEVLTNLRQTGHNT